jgi:hypothetical protein
MLLYNFVYFLNQESNIVVALWIYVYIAIQLNGDIVLTVC